MKNKNLVNCKACDAGIAKGVKKCPGCGKDQRNFFMKHKIISLILIALVFGGVSTALTNSAKDKIEYVSYSYGEVVKENNVVKEESYKMPEDVEIIFESQTIITAEELAEANMFNSANNDMAVLEVTMINNSNEAVSYNELFTFDFSTHNKVQLNSSLSFEVLPDEYNDSMGSGDLMPGSRFTRFVAVEIPSEDTLETVKWNYSGVSFTVKLPK